MYGSSSYGANAYGTDPAPADASAPTPTASDALLLVGVGSGATAPNTAIPFDIIQNFSSGSGALDTTKLAAGAHGANWGTWQVAEGVAVDHTTIEDHAVTLPFNLEVDGTLYNGSEGQGITFDHTGSPEEQDAFDLVISGTKTDVQGLLLARFDITDASGGLTDYNVDVLMCGAASNYSVAQLQNDFTGSNALVAHGEGALGFEVPYTTGWVIIGLRHDSTNGEAELFMQDASTETVLGASIVTHAPAAGNLSYVRIQDYLRYAGVDKTGSIKIKLLALREDMTFPPYTVSVPVAASVTATQTDVGEITLTWTGTCQRFLVERRVNGGAWATVDADHRTSSLVQTGLTDGSLYEYRVSSLIGSQSSAAVESNDVTINDETFLGGEFWISQSIGGSNLETDQQVGFKFTVGDDPITLTELGFWCLGGGVQYPTHDVRVYDASGTLLGSVTVPTNLVTNDYQWGTLGTPLDLDANTSYYLMTNPMGYGRVKLYTTVTPVPAITVDGNAYGTAPTFTLEAVANRIHGPLNAIYTLT